MNARIVAIDDAAIKNAAILVHNGVLIAYPTDTVYGLGCDPFNRKAVESLIQIKKRTRGSLPILVDTFATAEKLAVFDSQSKRLAARLWPGPLTIILPARANFPSEVLSSGTIGLRVPGREDTVRLVRECGGALVGTSANISGARSPVTAAEVAAQLGDTIPLILDGGHASIGRDSTVVRCEGGKLTVLREGSISKQTLFQE